MQKKIAPSPSGSRFKNPKPNFRPTDGRYAQKFYRQRAGWKGTARQQRRRPFQTLFVPARGLPLAGLNRLRPFPPSLTLRLAWRGRASATQQGDWWRECKRNMCMDLFPQPQMRAQLTREREGKNPGNGKSFPAGHPALLRVGEVRPGKASSTRSLESFSGKNEQGKVADSLPRLCAEKVIIAACTRAIRPIAHVSPRQVSFTLGDGICYRFEIPDSR